MKDLIARLFGIKTYEKEYLDYKDYAGNVEAMLNIERKTSHNLAAQLIETEKELESMKKIPEQYIIEELEKKTAEIKQEYKDRMEHKWYQIGRQDAYREMGIGNIEAHERGNILVQLPNGDIVEQILGLEDVKPSGEGVLSYDEIIIDDLVDIGA